MNLIEKRDFIHCHLHQVGEPVINEMYDKMQMLFHDVLIEESEDDISNGALTEHEAFKKEVLLWRNMK